MQETGLPIDALQAYGLSTRTIERWKTAYGERLLPLQSQAAQSTKALNGGNVIVFAPTSSGKTFVAEMAALKHLENRRRVIYLVPTRALAEEKFREFSERYSEMGFDIRVATRERPETDRHVLAGRFDLLIAIYEKMKSYLVVRPELLSQVGLVVMDEVQMLGEPGRGQVVDLILTKMARAPYGAQFIGLSAVLGDSQRIADWLGCELLSHRGRPVELREGVFNCADHKFGYRCFNSGDEGEERLYPKGANVGVSDENFGREAILSLALELAGRNEEQTLVFVPTRQTARSWAAEAAQRSDMPAATEALKQLGTMEDSHSRELLDVCLRSGLAFHNSDLSPELRRLIEEHYNAGAIRLLISTSTLAQGVNLTTRNVIQIPEMIATEQWTGGTHVVPLSIGRFKNQGGRAARYGHGAEYGRSIVVARGDAERDRLRAEFLSDRLESLNPPLLSSDLVAIVTDLVAASICKSRDELVDFLVNTYSGLTAWSPNVNEFTMKVDEALAEAYECHFLERDSRGGLTASGLGAVLASSGIRSQTATLLGEWVRSLTEAEFPTMEPLLVAAFAPDVRDYPVWLTDYERRSANYLQLSLDALGGPFEEVNSVLQPLLRPPGGFTDDDHASLKMAVLMNEWIGERETREIEESFRMYAGAVAGLGAQFNWLLQTAAALSVVYGLGIDLGRDLMRLAEQLSVGVEKAGVPLARLRVEGLNRTAVRNLIEAGFDTPRAVAEASEETLSTVIPTQLARDTIATAQRVLRNQSKARVADGGEMPFPGEWHEVEESSTAHEARLIIDLRGPGHVTLDGVRLRLPPLSYRLLLALARRPSRGVTYDDLMTSVWEGAIVDKQQVSMHRARLVKALAEVVGDDDAARMIETRAGFGLVLHLLEGDVEIRE